MKLETVVSLFQQGQRDASEMLQVGNQFQGSWQLGDAAGYARDSAEFRAYTLGAYQEIRFKQIFTENGVIVALI